MIEAIAKSLMKELAIPVLRRHDGSKWDFNGTMVPGDAFFKIPDT
jgi:hypothetical protein